MSNANDFIIENGVLTKYVGPGGDVVIPGGVTSIGDYAFALCEKLTKVTIPAGVTVIGSYAFQWCKNLVEVSVPEEVTSIETAAFAGCTSLAEINISAGVTHVRYNAFEDCRGLTKVTVSSSAVEIDSFLFSSCPALTEIDVASDNTKYCTVNGVLFTKDMMTLVIYPSGKTEPSYDVPEGVTSICPGAFYNCVGLTHITIPDSVTNIGYSAFSWCENLTEIAIPAGVTSIKERTFSDCENLTEIAIPAGVTSIGKSAFSDCEKLTKVTIPAGVTVIGRDAFCGCKNLTDITIPAEVKSIGSMAFYGCERLTEVVFPAGVTSIENYMLSGCSNLVKVVIPDGVTRIENCAFDGCKSLKKIAPIPANCKLDNGAFGECFPIGLVEELGELYSSFTDALLKQCVLCKKLWEKMKPELKTEIFLNRQGKPLLEKYKALISPEDANYIGETLLDRLSGKVDRKNFSIAANFMTDYYDVIEDDLLQKLYDELKEQKAAAKALAVIGAHTPLIEKLTGEARIDKNLSEIEQFTTQMLRDSRKGIKDIEKELKDFYGIEPRDLPNVCDKNNAIVPNVSFAQLLMLHEELEKENRGKPDVVAAYKKPGFRPEAQEILAHINDASLQQALLTLADKHLGLTGRSKKMFLAYPICRYANEETMVELTKRAPKWRSSVSGNDAPPLATFRKANIYSETRAAMLFADRYRELDEYAALRGTTADAIRDQLLSDVGVDERGRKNYDLGNQIVTAVLQSDLSFLIELPDGKISKSLPKKGADEDKYKVANADFSEMKKAVKRITKNRSTILFEDYITGRERAAKEWCAAYLGNPVLCSVAKLLVWSQDGKTFTVDGSNAVTVGGSQYAITEAAVKLAHPMEMKADEVAAWQKYFTSYALKQPFEQIWEPVVDSSSVHPKRYAGCMIPYYRFIGQAKRGITVEDLDFHNEIYIHIYGWDAVVERIDWHRHEINADDRFEIKSFSYKKNDRRSNHLIAYFDRATVFERIRNDDVSVAENLPQFTLAQLSEFIRVASENNCNNVMAMLLDYKQKHFAEFDPMDEFILDL